jgi:hypothetical protein
MVRKISTAVIAAALFSLLLGVKAFAADDDGWSPVPATQTDFYAPATTV